MTSGMADAMAAGQREAERQRAEYNRNKHTPEDFHGETGGAPTPPPLTEPSIAGAPKIPGGDGAAGGDIAVDTASIDQFGKNVAALVDPVKEALKKLEAVTVAPGAFPLAAKLKTQVEGQRNQFDAVLTNLVEGLTDLGRDMQELAKTYDTTEEANAMKGEDLRKAVDEASSDFQSVVSATPGNTTK